MTRILLALMLLASFSAQAADVSLSWSTPTTRENGDALPLAEIARLEIEATYPDGTSEVIDVNAAATTHVIPIINGEGSYTFSISTIDTDGMRSSPSETISTNILERSAPSGIQTLKMKVICQSGSVCNFYEAN